MLVDINDYDRVRLFNKIISKLDGDVIVKSGRYSVDGKSLMGLLSLDLSHDVFVEISADCGEDREEIIRELKEFGFITKN